MRGVSEEVFGYCIALGCVSERQRGGWVETEEKGMYLCSCCAENDD